MTKKNNKQDDNSNSKIDNFLEIDNIENSDMSCEEFNNNNNKVNKDKDKSNGQIWKNRCNEQVVKFKKEYFEKESSIFRGVVVYFDGLSGQVSSYHLKKLLFLNGGINSHWFSPTKCTHIVGSSMSLNKFEQIKRMAINTTRNRNGKQIQYVSSDWILDSCRLLSLQNESNYKLFNESTSFHGSKDIRSFFTSGGGSSDGGDDGDGDGEDDTTCDNNGDDFESDLMLQKNRNNDYNDIIETDEYSLFTKIKKCETLDDEELEQSLINPNYSVNDFITSRPPTTTTTTTTTTNNDNKYIDKNNNTQIKNDYAIERAQSKRYQ